MTKQLAKPPFRDNGIQRVLEQDESTGKSSRLIGVSGTLFVPVHDQPGSQLDSDGSNLPISVLKLRAMLLEALANTQPKGGRRT